MAKLKVLNNRGTQIQIALGPDALGEVGSYKLFFSTTETGSFTLLRNIPNRPVTASVVGIKQKPGPVTAVGLGLPTEFLIEKSDVGLTATEKPLVFLKAISVDSSGTDLELIGDVTAVPTDRPVGASNEVAQEAKLVAFDPAKSEFVLVEAKDGKLKVDAIVSVGSIAVDLDKDDDSVAVAGTPDAGSSFVLVKTSATGGVVTSEGGVDDPPALVSSIDDTGKTVAVSGATSILLINTGAEQIQYGDDSGSAIVPLMKAEKTGLLLDFLHARRYFTEGKTNIFVKRTTAGSGGELTIIRRQRV